MFQEFPRDTGEGVEERPIEANTKTYWIPFNSIRISEIIPAKSLSEREDNEIQRRKPLQPREVSHRSSLE